ncbi:DUF262 domain-containing protein [Fannyhessea vaginae]|uniref:DUF262 domain-containing protein n=1 Tax=Fannyhessea vaginae TaxID=82135 RepID=UPI00205E5B8C|nr:MAG TPA: Protein of unknown function DUF262 [Caudoviricetes sp.]
MIYQRLNITPSSMPIISLMTAIKNVNANGLDISPDYQRGYIWSSEYKDQLILSIILNYPIGNIVINNLDHANVNNSRQELVDGKQRLSTIFRFIECGNTSKWFESSDTWFRLSKRISDQAKAIIDNIIGQSDPEGLKAMHKVKRLSFTDLPNSIKMNFNAYNIPVYTMQAADPAQIRDYFKVLQNQEKLRAGEIINSLPENPMSKFFEQIPTKALLEKLNCTNGFRRAELEKVYYSVLGVWFDKLQLNTADKIVISFVENIKNLNEEEITAIKRLNEGIKAIAAIPQSIEYRATKRTMKLLFGLALQAPSYFGGDDVFSKVTRVCELSERLAAFNTSESEDVAFSRYFSDEYAADKKTFMSYRAPVYRTLFWSTARASNKKSYARAIKIMELLFTDSFERAYDFYLSTNNC